MPILAHKVQVLLTDEQYRLLLKLAKAQRKPLSVVLREGVVEQVIKEARRAAKRTTLRLVRHSGESRNPGPARTTGPRLPPGWRLGCGDVAGHRASRMPRRSEAEPR